MEIAIRGFVIKRFRTEEGPTPDGRYRVVVKTLHGAELEVIECGTRDEALGRLQDEGYEIRLDGR